MTTPVDVFPRDEGERLVYVVQANRSLHFDDTRHYSSGDEVALTVDRVNNGLSHIVRLRDDVQAQESETDDALTRAASHPRRRVKAKRK